MLVDKTKLFKYLLDEMLLATQACMAEYHSVSTSMPLITSFTPAFRDLFSNASAQWEFQND